MPISTQAPIRQYLLDQYKEDGALNAQVGQKNRDEYHAAQGINMQGHYASEPEDKTSPEWADWESKRKSMLTQSKSSAEQNIHEQGNMLMQKYPEQQFQSWMSKIQNLTRDPNMQANVTLDQQVKDMMDMILQYAKKNIP